MSGHQRAARPFAAALLVMAAGAASAAGHSSGWAGDKAAITAVMVAYEHALNAASTVEALDLYTDDAVLMAPNGQPVVGKPAIRSAYIAGNKIFNLQVKFKTAEVVEMAPTWAFVRTSSTGTMKMLATGAENPEANQELFILRKDAHHGWRIARYSFSTTSPGA
jgi:uncharacterized protein (TIGR02246 family)